MPVALFLPVVTYARAPDADLLPSAPRYVRGRSMSRWHRPRSGLVYRDQDRVVLHFWCGQGVGDADRALYRDEPPDEPVCGTCVGRAVGAGQDEQPIPDLTLLFSPRSSDAPPRVCPGATLTEFYVELPGRRTGTCLGCGESHRICGGSRGYGWTPLHLSPHPPGIGLVPPCVWHGWKRYANRDDRPVCLGCLPGGWP